MNLMNSLSLSYTESCQSSIACPLAQPHRPSAPRLPASKLQDLLKWPSRQPSPWNLSALSVAPSLLSPRLDMLHGKLLSATVLNGQNPDLEGPQQVFRHVSRSRLSRWPFCQQYTSAKLT